MAKKHRVRARSRRSVEASRRASASRPASIPEREVARPIPARARPSVRAGVARAHGAPSAALERAAALERRYVLKDFRRIAVVVVVALALLVVSGIVLGIIERPA